MKAMNVIQNVLINSALVLILASCTTLDSISSGGSPRTITLNGTSYSEEEYGSFDTWVCRDYSYGGKILVEVGRFEDPNLLEYGFILYDGTSSGDLTTYQRKGVNLRWDWETTGGSFAFILKSDGTGYFYDFSKASSDGMTTSDTIYKCSRR